MRAIVLISQELAAICVAGQQLQAHFTSLVERAGHSFSDEQHGLALYIDGRYPAVHASTLSALQREGDAVCTPSGAPIAAVLERPERLPDASGDRVHADEAHDVLSPGGLSRAERSVRLALALDLERAGVAIVDPARLTIDGTVRVEPGARLWPDVVLLGTTVVEGGAEVQSGCWLQDTHVCEGALIKPHSVCNGAHVGPACQVGPMAHLRPGAVLERSVKVGNFVEVKKTVLREGAKASHLTYLGDTEVGAHANIGAGTITCNYDGFRKQRTVIGEGAFIGSNSSLVAPVNIGAGAIVGAGSVLTRDVPPDGLAVERGTLRVLEGKASRLNKRNAALAQRERDKKSDTE